MVTKIDASMFDAQGKEIILDADADTSITADTDDQIDIKIGGADDFQFTANTLTALSGSTIATNTIAETTGASGVTIDGLLIKDGGIDLNGVELILDADADTSITADTDDQIDIRIAGADDFQFTANTFTALSGSTVTIASGATIANSGTATGFPSAGKNLLLNGGFTVAQRASVTGIGGSNYTYYGTDGWCHYGTTSSGRYTASQATAGATDGPFRDCLQVDVTTADTGVSGNKVSGIMQKMEGQNLQHLHWGQATDDQALALSFWVKSPKTGTHCVSVYLVEGNDSCCTEYTVSVADTWEYKTVSFPAPGTAVPVIDNDANQSLWLVFPLMATGVYQATADAWQEGTEGYATSNQQNFLDNTANNFFLANVMLETGSTNTASTDFPAEDYGTTILKCLRYFNRIVWGAGNEDQLLGTFQATSSLRMAYHYPVRMRAVPTFSSSTATNFGISFGSTAVATLAGTAGVLADSGTIAGRLVAGASGTPFTIGYSAYLYVNTSGAYWQWSAEL